MPLNPSTIQFYFRAVMMAWDMVNKKRTELKQKAEGLQIVEKQYVMMKKAAADLANLFKYYEADVSDIIPNQM